MGRVNNIIVDETTTIRKGVYEQSGIEFIRHNSEIWIVVLDHLEYDNRSRKSTHKVYRLSHKARIF
jgi:hypothetical protein